MIAYLSAHRGPISALLGGLGLLVLALVLLQRAVRRAGGWRVVRRRFAHEVRRTAAAFGRPVRRWWRYRRRLELLKGLLADPQAWTTAEAALRDIPLPGRRQPYAVIVAGDAVGVYFAGEPCAVPDDSPWTADEDDPLLWWTPPGLDTPGEATAVLVAAGVEDTRGGVVFLDLTAGPATVATTGDERTGRALVQSIAAQLEARLPGGAVTIGSGVHPGFDGELTTPASEFLICAGVPGSTRTDLRTVRIGGAQGHARLLAADRTGLVRPAGTPLVLDVTALPRSVVRTLATIPPAPRRPDTGPLLDEDAFVASLDDPSSRPPDRGDPTSRPPDRTATAPEADPRAAAPSHRPAVPPPGDAARAGAPPPIRPVSATTHDEDEFDEPERPAPGVSATTGMPA
ncbi:hypothetical protein [Dactylosporangium sp. NPDC050588]|uniref:hypothetical protein n=1 Tax=Dactylosporangium sp. NPDC050588 TaxID=3157211 RepID=UPI003405139A